MKVTCPRESLSGIHSKETYFLSRLSVCVTAEQGNFEVPFTVLNDPIRLPVCGSIAVTINPLNGAPPISTYKKIRLKLI